MPILGRSPAKQDDPKPDVQDLLIEINLGTTEKPQPTHISAYLNNDLESAL